MKSLNAYSCQLNFQVAPGGGAYTNNWQIFSGGLKSKLRSILFNAEMRTNFAPILKLPPAIQTTQELSLQILTNSPISDFFRNFAQPAAYNGTQLMLRETGQYFFDSFYINELSFLILNCVNNEAANTIDYRVNIVIETEDEQIRYAK